MKKKTEFSKSLLIWETILIWFITIAYLVLVFFCIKNGYLGDLTWLSIIYGCPWAAYGVSQACYYKKAEKENTKGGIKYDSVMKAAEAVLDPETISKIQKFVEEFEQSEEPSNNIEISDEFKDAAG